jgi:hypothetical protein
MFLRSGSDWQLDAREVATFEAYLKQRGVTTEQIKPVPLETFLDYASWFMGQYAVKSHPSLVTHLASRNGAYIATLDDGSQILANHVLLALGFAFFKHYPRELMEKLPPGSYTHTCDTVDFEFYRGKRVLHSLLCVARQIHIRPQPFPRVNCEGVTDWMADLSRGTGDRSVFVIQRFFP